MTFHRNQQIQTPDGYTGVILLHNGSGVTVWLSNANQLPQAERVRWYDKREFNR